jgi:putative hydrolase of the HAD superfamily
MASMIPATTLASVCRAAKPMIAAAMAPEARRLVARRSRPVTCDSAIAIPIRMIAAYSSRRMKRRRVSTSGVSSPRITASAMRRPRWASQRLSTNARISATTIVTTAVIHSSLADQKPPIVAASMAAESNAYPRAILLDALGTLLALEPPAPFLRDALRERMGLEISPERAQRAIAAEIGFYRAHLHEGGDRAGLAALRRRCAAAMAAELPPAAGEDLDALTDALVASLRFTPFPDAMPALTDLRRRGIKLAVVSNWDVSLHDVLERVGLAGLVDGAVASAELGSAKPDPAIFRRGLELAGGVEPAAAWHVGDTPGDDVDGARAAGIEPVLIVRGAPLTAAPPGVRVVATLTGLLPPPE